MSRPFVSSTRALVAMVVMTTSAMAPSALAEPAPTSPPSPSPEAWSARMDALGIALSTLAPWLVEDRPWDQDAETAVKEGLAGIASVAHSLAPGGAKRFPDSDPTLPLLTRELNRALDDAKNAHGEALKGDARLVVATCIGCHTRADIGVMKPKMTMPPITVSEAWLKADILLATRRFAEARQTYKAVVGDGDFAQTHLYLWERAVKRALVLEVRTAKDPAGALALVNMVLNTPGGESLWPDATAWQSDIKAWSREKPVGTNPRALYDRAAVLMTKADVSQRAPGDSSADVLYLRATAILHQLLSQPTDAATRAQSLAWLAIAYEALREVDVWSLYLIYNEACIEAAPHTTLAASCFERLERTVRTEFTGNGGGALPDVEARRLNRLRPLAGAKEEVAEHENGTAGIVDDTDAEAPETTPPLPPKKKKAPSKKAPSTKP